MKKVTRVLKKSSKKPSKIWKEERLDSFPVFELEGTIEKAITYLRHILTESEKAGYKDIRLEQGSCDDTGYLEVMGKRIETDKEYAKRAKLLEKTKAGAQKDKIDRRRYEIEELSRLRRKYPDV